MRISRSVLAAVLAGCGALGLAAGFAVADGPAHLAGNAKAGVTRPAGSAAVQDAALAALLQPATATPGDPIFMFINGINGESQDAKHPMWSQLTGYHVNFAGRTGTAGKAAMSSFVVTMPYSLAVPPLLSALVTGKVLPAVKIQAATAGEFELNYLTITLSNVRVSALSESSAGERPVESLAFTAAKFSVTYSAQNPDGSLGKTETFCFSFATQRAC
jgi:type VI secretion system secreted protein Hcp